MGQRLSLAISQVTMRWHMGSIRSNVIHMIGLHLMTVRVHIALGTCSHRWVTWWVGGWVRTPSHQVIKVIKVAFHGVVTCLVILVLGSHLLESLSRGTSLRENGGW